MLNPYDYKVVYLPSLSIRLSKDLRNYLKSYLIDSGIASDYIHYRRAVFVYNNNIEEFNKLPFEIQYAINFPILYPFLQDFHYYLLNQIFNSRRNKIYRLKSKLNYMFNNYDCVFLTFTFTDDFLSSTSSSTRRTYVSRFLKKYDLYVANIDFGEDDRYTKREHYHAVVCSEVDYSAWKCGALNGERVLVRNSSRVSTYLNKLTSHAFKDSTGSSRLIYSKSFANYLRKKNFENFENLLDM